MSIISIFDNLKFKLSGNLSEAISLFTRHLANALDLLPYGLHNKFRPVSVAQLRIILYYALYLIQKWIWNFNGCIAYHTNDYPPVSLEFGSNTLVMYSNFNNNSEYTLSWGCWTVKSGLLYP